MKNMPNYSSFGELLNANAAPNSGSLSGFPDSSLGIPNSFTVIPDTFTGNSAADAHTEFKRLYEMLPANSPAKRRQLLNLLKQYTSLNPQEKAEFDKFIISGNGASPQG